MPESKQKSAIPASQRSSYEVPVGIHLVGVALAAIAFAYHKYHEQLGLSNPKFFTITERVLYTIRLQVYSVIPLFLSFVHVLFNRVTNSLVRNPLAGNEDLIVKAHRILANTIEQFIFHSANILVFAVVIPDRYNLFIGFLVACFVLGRILFMLGYMIHPKHRGYGFAMTFVPTTVVFFYNLAKVSNFA